MRIKRLLAFGVAGMLAVASVCTNSVPVYATAEEDIIEFSDSDELVTEDAEEDEFTDEAPSDEATDDYEEAEPEEEFVEDEVESEDLLLQGSMEETAEEEEAEGEIYSAVFYPGEGLVISSLDFGQDVEGWEYDPESGIMTAYVPSSVEVLRDVKYALIVPDGTKEFSGWYLDKEFTEKADFVAGVPVESDIELFAKFRDTGKPADDEFIVSDILPAAEDSADKSGLPWPEEIIEAEIVPEAPDSDTPASDAPAVVEEPEVEEPQDEEPIAFADSAVPQKEYINLEDAKLSRQVPSQDYKENDGVAQPVGGDVSDLFKDGTITVSVGSDKLQYVEDGDASTISKEGYYFTVSDPAESDSDVNRHIGDNNYVTLVPTDAPKYNLVEGEIDVPFTISGTELVVKNINSTIYYDGDPVLVYTGRDDNGDGVPDVDNEETVRRIGGVITDSDNEVLAGDRYTITAANDSAEVGTVMVAFEGKAERGVTGRVTQNIKIVRRELSAADVEVKFADKKLNASSVPMVNGQATPSVSVRLSGGGSELVKDRDYSVVYSDNNAAGKNASVSLKFAGNYSGTLNKVLTFTVAKNVLSKDSVVASVPDKRYSIFSWLSSFKSTPVLKYGDTTLILNNDYVYVEQPTYYYANDVVKKNIFGRVTLSRKAGQKIPDNESVPSGAKIECRFSIVPSSATQAYTAATDKSGNYKPISYSIVYNMK